MPVLDQPLQHQLQVLLDRALLQTSATSTVLHKHSLQGRQACRKVLEAELLVGLPMAQVTVARVIAVLE